MKYTIILLFFLSLSFTACVTPARISKLTENNLGAKRQNYPIQFDDYVFVDTNNITYQSSMAYSRKVKNLFIPAILYWQWEKNIECIIDPQYAINLFMQEAMKMAEEKELKKRLNGQKLRLSFKEIPNNYVYSHKGHTIVLLFAYAVADAEHLYPSQNTFKINYQIVSDTTISSSGEISLTHNIQSMHNTRSTTGMFTNAFLDAYTMEIKRLGKEFTNKIIYKI